MSSITLKQNRRTNDKTFKTLHKKTIKTIKTIKTKLKSNSTFIKASCAPTAEKKDYTCYSDT